MQLFRLVQLSSLLFFCGFGACASEPIVRTQNGDVGGVTQGQVESFKALPYAAPPVGPLRWMPPREPENFTGIRDASKFSAECPQKPEGQFTGNEDCLYLNVFRPVGARALPVIVFIHGGSNVRGSASQTLIGDTHMYDGSQLALRNVVVVTLNYRLGALGFIAHPKLSKASGYDGSGNYAYMDQAQALKWVQRNISAFGGDPGNVTLWGQSAGAKSVWVHLTSPESRGLFHRAVAHSAVREGAKKLSDQEGVGVRLSQGLGCRNAADELTCMRGKSAQEVVNALESSPGSGNYAAVVDMKVLTESPIKIMQDGQHHHMPILQGNVEEELSMLGARESQGITTEEKYVEAIRALIERKIPDASVDELLRQYPSSEYQTHRKAFNAIGADREYICPARRVLRALTKSQTEFVGRFFYSHTLSSGQLRPFGASHGLELLFIFDTLKSADVDPMTDTETALVKSFQDIWSSYSKTGAIPDLWKRYDGQRDNHAIFGDTVSDGNNLRTRQCDFWDTKAAP